jgi:hypothetical protein
MRFLFRVTRHSAFVRISINTSQGFPYSAYNLLETRQFRPQLGEFFRLFREVIFVVTNPMRQIAEFFLWHFGVALFRPRSGRSSRVLLVPNYHQIVIQNEKLSKKATEPSKSTCARAFQSRCQRHRKRGSLPDVSRNRFWLNAQRQQSRHSRQCARQATGLKARC